jgi:choline dehydrogenase
LFFFLKEKKMSRASLLDESDFDPAAKRVKKVQPPTAWSASTWMALFGVAAGLLVIAIVLSSVFGALWGNLRHREKQCGSVSIDAADECWNYVVVGSGACGSAMTRVLANVTNPSVLLLEAGDDLYNQLNIVKDPDFGLAIGFDFYKPHLAWIDVTVRQLQLASTMDFMYGGARMLGGSTGHNVMQVVHPPARFWDELDASLGASGIWAATRVTSKIQAQENFTAQGFYVEDAARGTTGPWQVTTRPLASNPDAVSFSTLLKDAYGFPSRLDDYNLYTGPEVGSFEKWQWQQIHNDGSFWRETAATAFLKPGVKATIRLRSTVTKLLWDPKDDKHCIGVQYLTPEGDIKRVYAKNSVILSTGPRDALLLQREGIAPASVLSSANISARIINENVGKFTNHIGHVLTFLWPNMTGTSAVDSIHGDIGLPGGGFVPDPAGSDPTRRGYQIIPVGFPGGVAVLYFGIEPRSEGTTTVQDSDPLRAPLIDPKYFTDSYDVTSARAFVRDFVAKMEAADPNCVFVSLNPSELADDATLDAFLQTDVHQAIHWFGMARMATSAATGVIDPRTRVFGTSGLRVCSASMMPKPVPGNPATAFVAMGEICGELINQDFA